MLLAELDRGCHGGQVKLLQHLLNDAGVSRPPLRLDGMFGSRTDQAVRGYQQRHGLLVDGIAGRDTWAKLEVKPTSLPNPKPGRPAAANPAVMPLTPHFVPPGRAPVAAAPAPAAPARPAPAPVSRAVPLPVTTPLPAATDAPWMAIAEAEEWVMERTTKGTKRIIEYHATTGGFTSDQIAWCSSFVNWCLRQAHIRGTNNAAAASWAHWGTALDVPRYGAIVQLHHGHKGHDRNTGSSSGNHVGFLVRKTETHVTLLGGNQSDRVKLSNFPLASYAIAAMRWPN